MRHPLRWIAIGVAVLVTGFAVVLASQVGGDPRADSNVSQLLGEAAPGFTVTTFDGARFTEADLAGRAVIVNFWNTWCVPCQEELPALKAFYARHASEPDFVMLGIVRSDTAGAARAYAKAHGMDWVIATDPDADAALAFGTRGQPETYAITPDGQIVASQFAPARVKDLETMLDAARGRELKSGRTLSWALLGCVVFAAIVWAAWPSGSSQTDRERAHEVAITLRCPDCEALSVADSSTPTARAIRRDVLRRVKAGESAGTIRAAYIDRYGESILLDPAGSGLGVLVWGLPIAALIAGGAGLVFASRRWRRQPQLHATDADEALVNKTRHA